MNRGNRKPRNHHFGEWFRVFSELIGWGCFWVLWLVADAGVMWRPWKNCWRCTLARMSWKATWQFLEFARGVYKPIQNDSEIGMHWPLKEFWIRSENDCFWRDWNCRLSYSGNAVPFISPIAFLSADSLIPGSFIAFIGAIGGGAKNEH